MQLVINMKVKNKYSASTNAFYAADLIDEYIEAGTLPTDAVDVDTDTFVEFTNDPPEGKVRAAGKKGLPAWIGTPKPAITPE